MIDQWPGIFYFHQSFAEDMRQFLGEALMWPVLIWLVWVLVQRVASKRRAA